MPQPIPPFSLERQNLALGSELHAALERVLASGRFTQGAECAALEAELAAWMPAQARVRAVVCSSGTDALHLALSAVGVQAGDVVLTTAFSFFATAGAILLAGARPEFVDIDADTFNLDPACLESALKRPHAARIGAILPVHLYGQLADMPEICRLAEAAGVPVVEDAAQAIGAEVAGRCAGAWGRAGCFSFYPTKNLGALGEGGMVSTSDPEIEDRLRLLRVHGSRQRYQHEVAGWNGRMHEFQAAVLRAKLPHLKAWIERRRAIAAAYIRNLEPLVSGLPKVHSGHVFHQFVVRVPDRDAVRARLLEHGVATEVYYPGALHQQPALAPFPPPVPVPEAERAAREVLALPMFPELDHAEVERVCAAMKESLT